MAAGYQNSLLNAVASRRSGPVILSVLLSFPGGKCESRPILSRRRLLPPIGRLDPERIVFACSCEGTMPLDEAALARGCGGALRRADQLCRRELDRFQAAVA